MGIDRDTAPRFINFVLEDTPKYLKSLREQANADGQNDDKEDIKKLSLTCDNHSVTIDEYYFEEADNELNICGEMLSSNGSTYYSLAIPLSDVVLIDILQYSLKKLAKLKTAMETLK